MDYIAFTPYLTDIRKDHLQDIKNYATYICVSEEEAATAINLFGRDKIYIIMYFQEPDFNSIRKLNIDNFIIQIPEAFFSDELKAFSFMFFETATTWEQLNNYASKGATAILINSPLTFQSNAIKKWKQKYAVKIFATADSNKITDVRQWFLRPEDCTQCEGSLDAICIKPSLVSIYAHGISSSKLSVIIPSIDETQDINALYLPPNFQEKRLNCRQRCQEPNGLCSYCLRIIEITKQMERMKSDGR